MKNHPYKISPSPRDLLSHALTLINVIAAIFLITSCSNVLPDSAGAGRTADIFPEYYDLTIPPNIAPLNFMIREPGSRYRVEISAGDDTRIRIRQKSPVIRIPLKAWQELLSVHAGDTLRVDIWSKRDGAWSRYTPIRHRIAAEPIDPWLAYRLVHAVYLKWNRMGIYQRNLTSFEERPIIENTSTGNGCMNCHSFADNDPDKMMIHFRISHPGTLIWNEGKLSKIDTRTKETLSPGIYPSWHPDGTHIAFSTGRISPHLTTRLGKVVDVADRASDLVVYDIGKNEICTSPEVSTRMRETMPAWAADGKSLYYICAPEAEPGDDESLLHSRYSLMRIPFNTKHDSWGKAALVLSADSTGMSISLPSVSPEGRYLACTMTDYGYFTIFHRISDIYIVDLETGKYWKPELNSEYSESQPSWSSSGRWLVFSSKRMDGVLSRPYIAYIDRDGHAHRPFVVPQKDPRVYDRILANFNLPRLLKDRVELRPVEIRDLVMEDPVKAKFRN
jgi:hypothetical protein